MAALVEIKTLCDIRMEVAIFAKGSKWRVLQIE